MAGGRLPTRSTAASPHGAPADVASRLVQLQRPHGSRFGAVQRGLDHVVQHLDGLGLAVLAALQAGQAERSGTVRRVVFQTPDTPEATCSATWCCEAAVQIMPLAKQNSNGQKEGALTVPASRSGLSDSSACTNGGVCTSTCATAAM